MKRRITITNVLILFCSSLLLLLSFFFFLYDFNLKNEKQEIANYLNIVCEVYDGENNEQVGEIIKKIDNSMRLTIIAKDGQVLYDSSVNGELESHLERPEIVNLGSVSYRYSNTLKTKMLYIAAFDDGNYVRLAIKANDINRIINSMLIVELVVFMLLIAISSYSINKISKKVLLPIKQEMIKLGTIVGDNSDYYADNINVISNNIDHIQKLINEKVESLEKEKNKINFIINSLQQGLVILNEDKNIVLINDYAKKIFETNIDIIGNNYLYLVRDKNIQEKIENVYQNKQVDSYELKQNNSTYLLTFAPLGQEWLDDTNTFGISIIIVDISGIRNVEKMKKEFFANASHELKSPLTTIIGYQQLIANDLISDEEEKKKAINKTLKEANRMNNIIKDMLDIARLEGDIKRSYSKVDLKQIIEDTLDLYSQEIKENHLVINKFLTDTYIIGNESDVTKLIKNIIDNAIKYNKKGGKINITLTPYELIVEDSGIGISENDLKHVFERFYRVDKTKSKEMLGTGLGLSIVKHICQTYNYTITFDSQIDVGSKVKIKFK